MCLLAVEPSVPRGAWNVGKICSQRAATLRCALDVIRSVLIDAYVNLLVKRYRTALHDGLIHGDCAALLHLLAGATMRLLAPYDGRFPRLTEPP